MTPWHYRWLCQFSYIDLPDEACIGQTLGALCRRLLRLDEADRLPCGRLGAPERQALDVLEQTKETRELVLVDFINRNRSTGLVAYALQAPDGSAHVIFRGSEKRGCGVSSSIDWADNILAPFLGSVQYPEIEALARRYPQERVCFSGHSKGAHNALYALAAAANGRAQAVVFNGQGFAPGLFAKGQRKRLARQGVNYVVRGDVVGSLLHHPERRVFVKKQGHGDAHALSSLSFDRQGQPIPARRPFWSAALEWGTVRYLLSREIRPGQAL